MKEPSPAGLIFEGNSTHSAILRLPNLALQLGPIKAATLRVSRRVSNFIRAGYAIETYEEFQDTSLVLIRVPDSAVPRYVDEVCASDLTLKDISFVLCESWLSLDVLDPLRARGATTGTLLAVPSALRNWFVIEGQYQAVRQARRFIESNEGRVLELRAGTKSFYFAAELLATALPMPLFLAAQHALKCAGISGNNKYFLIEEMAQSVLKAFLKGARATWGGPLAETAEEVATAHFQALRQNDPDFAQYLEEQLACARERIVKQEAAAEQE